MAITVLDLFSGIGGFSYAAEKLVGGFTTTQFVECDPYCQKVLQKHWPAVALHGDIRTFTAEPRVFDVITAGFPCQDLSVAGKQAGLSAERSGLFYEVIRLARELRPKFLLLENVANLATHQNGETFQEVLFQIAKAGFDAEWAVIPASDVGACHQRKRIWIVAYTKSQQCNDSESTNSAKSPRVTTKPRDCSSADVTHTNDQRLQGRKSVFVPEHTLQWSAGTRNSHLLSPDWRTYVSKPALCRGDDGLSGRVDRLKALGNSIVPQVAAIPLQRIKELSLTH